MGQGAGKGPVDPGPAVRLAVVGAGVIGRTHAALAARLPGIRLVGLADPDPAARELAGRLGVPWFAHHRELLEAAMPEGVVIATPTATHPEVGLDCARHGVHLLVEKPLAADLAGGRRLVDGARKQGVRLLVGHHRRFNPAVEAVRRAVAAGVLGRLVAVSVLWTVRKPDAYFDVPWRRRPGAGPVLTNLIHELDSLRVIAGEIARVSAETGHAARGGEVEDTAAVVLRFANGALGTILASDAVPSRWSYEAATGENPTYFHTQADCGFFCGTAGSLAFPSLTLTRYPEAGKAGWQHPLVSERLPAGAGDPLEAQLVHFGRVVRGLEAPRTDGEDGLRTLEAAFAVLAAARTGRPVDLAAAGAAPG